MESRGGVTGGATIDDFLVALESRGFTGQFVVRPAGRLACCTCGEESAAEETTVRSFRRVEGSSEPDMMTTVAALECPRCGAQGTATFCYGPLCPPEDGEVLRHLRQERPVNAILGDLPHDVSLVSDTGWLRGPDG